MENYPTHNKKDKKVIENKLQRYVVQWYHAYLLHIGLDIMDPIIWKICTGPEYETTSILKLKNVTYYSYIKRSLKIM